MKLAINFTFLLLAGCSTAPTPIPPDVFVPPQNREIYPRPLPLTLRPIEWAVLSAQQPDTYTLFFSQHDAAMCLPTKGYEGLSLNMQEMIRFLKEQKALVEVYERERREDNEFLSTSRLP